MIISTPPVEAAEGQVADMYRGDLREDGFVYSHTRMMAVNPVAHAAFEELVRAVVPSIGVRTYELATLGAAGRIGSSHCLLAHGRRSLREGIVDEGQLVAVAAGETGELSEADAAVVAYAARLSANSAGMTDEDSRRLREVGFTDRQIVDITLAAAARNFFSRALQALAVPVERVPGLDESVAAALIGGQLPPQQPPPPQHDDSSAA